MQKIRRERDSKNKMVKSMDKQERKDIICRIGDLIENHCNGCEKKIRDKRGNTNDFCNNDCQIGAELRSLGELLEGKTKKEGIGVSKQDLTVEKYKELKTQGLTDRQVAKELKVSLSTLYNFKRKNGLMDGRGSYKRANKDREKTTNDVAKQSNFEKVVDIITANLADTLKFENQNDRNAFMKTFEKYGYVSTNILLFDKLNRFETLIEGKHKVDDKSIEDSLLDMASYCILTLAQNKIRG